MRAEQLEQRAMMAILTYDRVDGSTVVAIDGNGGLTDLYFRGTPGNQVEFATNTQFSKVRTVDTLDFTNDRGLNDNLYNVAGSRPLYITSATPNQRVIPLQEATGFTQGDTSRTTDFALSNGNIYTTQANTVSGEVRLGTDRWTFASDRFGRLFFTADAGNTPGAPAPVDGTSTVSPGNTDRDNRGAGNRGAVTIRWSQPVSTYFDDCPRIDVTYLYDPRFDVFGNFFDAKSGGDFEVGVSAGSNVGLSLSGAITPKDAFEGVTVMTAGGINRVPGTTVQSGTITVYDVLTTGATGSGKVNLTFNFSNATGGFVFTPRQNDWLQIAEGSTPTNLRFRNAFGVPGTTLDPGEAFVVPGRVTISGSETWFEYTIENRASQVTLWPGLNVTNDITAEYTRDGGSFNVLSPIVAAPSLAVLGATDVSFEAPISVGGQITLANAAVVGTSWPSIVTAKFDAPSAASSYFFRAIGSVTVSPTGSLAGALPDASGVLSQPANLVQGDMVGADLLVYGTIYANTQFYDLRAAGFQRSTTFTTQPEFGGPDTGLIRGGTVVVNMATPGAVNTPPDAMSDDISYHTVSLQTQVDTFRTRAASTGIVLPGENMFPYNLSVREVDSITFDAVAGSSRPISLEAGGSIVMGSALATASDLTIQALPGAAEPSRFSVAGPLSTSRGKIRIVADGVTIGNSVSVTAADEDVERDDIWITANAGDVALNSLVSAVNRVKIQQVNPLGPTVSTYASRGGPLPVPDNGRAVQTIEVPDDFVFTDLDVEVDITHPFVGDLSGTLIAPDGRRFSLFARNGGSGDNFTDTIFDSEATRPIGSGAAPFTGRFRPVESLATLYGGSALGTWQLEITDSALADVGTLESFSLRFGTLAPQVVKVFGTGRVVADSLLFDVQGRVGDPSLLPVDPKFFLRTDVNTISGSIGNSVSIDELNDVAIPSLRAGGFVSLRANGVDPTSGPNAGKPSLQANLIDITGLDVATPNGSVDVFFDTSKSIELGNAQGLRTGRSLNSAAAGDVKIRSNAGSIVALDAPVAGGNARVVRVATRVALANSATQNGATMSLVTYSPGNPGVTASTLRGRGNLNTWLGVQIQPLRVGDRVLLKDQTSQEQNGVYAVSFMSTPTWTPTTTWTLTRAADSDTAAELPGNSFVSVGEPQTGGASQVGTYQITANYIPLNGATFNGVTYAASPAKTGVNYAASLTRMGVTYAASTAKSGVDYSTPLTLTGITYSASPTRTGVTYSSGNSRISTNTTGLRVGDAVFGTGIRPLTTIANIGNGAITLSLSTTAGSPAGGATLRFASPITVGDSSGLRVGDAVFGTGIQAGTTIASIPNATSFTLSRPTTAGGTSLTLVSPVRANDTNGLRIGDAVFGWGIQPGTTIAGIGIGTITLSQQPSAGSRFGGETLYFGNLPTISVGSTAGLTVGDLVVGAGAGIQPGTTIASMNNSAGTITLSQYTTAGSRATGETLYFGNPTIPVSSVTGLQAGDPVFGPGILPDTTITSIDPVLNTITLSLPTTAASGSGGETLYFGNPTISVGSTAGLQVGDAVFGDGIQIGTTIASIGAGTITLSTPITAASSGGSLKTVSAAVTRQGTRSSGLDDVFIKGLSTTSDLKVGMLVVGAGIPDDTVITRILNGTTVVMSRGATAAGSGDLSFITPFATRAGTTTAAGGTMTGLSATGDLLVGMVVVGPGLDADTTIASIDNAGQITLSRPVNSAQAGASFKFLAASQTNFGRAPITVAAKTVTTDIGSNNPNSKVTFVVTTNAGTNSAAGSLGKMITLRQQNVARFANDAAEAVGSQPMDFRFSSAVATILTPIQLTQELPEITKAFTISGTPTYQAAGVSNSAIRPLIDGSRITRTRSGRSLVDGDMVSGLVVRGAAASGTVISDVTIGGFSRSASSGGTTQRSGAIEVIDAAGVLVSNVNLGIQTDPVSKKDFRLANGVGVRFSGAGATSGTLLNSRVLGSDDSGLVVENGASRVSVVGTTFGSPDIFNGVGATLSSGVNQFGVDAVTPVQPIPQVQATRLAANQFRFTVAANDGWSPWRLVSGMQILSPNVLPTTGNTRATISAVSVAASGNNAVVTVTVAGGTVTAPTPATAAFAVTFVNADPASIPDTLATRVENRFTLPTAQATGIIAGMHVSGTNIRLAPGSTRATVTQVGLSNGVTTFEITGGTVVGDGAVTFGSTPATRFARNVMKVIDTFTISSAARSVAAVLSTGLGLTGPSIQVNEPADPSIKPTPASIAGISRNLATGVTTVTIAGATITGNGNVSFGHVVYTELDKRTITLPSSVNMTNLFLGQTVRGAGITGATTITAIDVANRTVTFAEDRKMTRTGFSAITFVAGGRNTITQNRTGLILADGATTVTNTTITANTFNGIEIRGSGITVGGDTLDHRIGTTLATVAGSNQIHSNQGWGIYFTAAMNNVRPSTQSPLKNFVKIQGNFLGTTTLAVVSSTLSNKKGNIGHIPAGGREAVFAGLTNRLVPRGVDGLDASNNQHGRYQAAGGGGGSGTGGTR